MPLLFLPSILPSDLRLKPHLHAAVLDGWWHEEGGELRWDALGDLKTSEVGGVLEHTVTRIERHLRRRGLLRNDEDPEGQLAASAVSGRDVPRARSR